MRFTLLFQDENQQKGWKEKQHYECGKGDDTYTSLTVQISPTYFNFFFVCWFRLVVALFR